MGSRAKTDYCAFTKAVEHLGDLLLPVERGANARSHLSLPEPELAIGAAG